MNRLLCPLTFLESDCLSHGILFWIVIILIFWIIAFYIGWIIWWHAGQYAEQSNRRIKRE